MTKFFTRLLRDYFAAKAMQALVQANFRSQEVIPHYAYILADAMLDAHTEEL